MKGKRKVPEICNFSHSCKYRCLSRFVNWTLMTGKAKEQRLVSRSVHVGNGIENSYRCMRESLAGG